MKWIFIPPFIFPPRIIMFDMSLNSTMDNGDGWSLKNPNPAKTANGLFAETALRALTGLVAQKAGLYKKMSHMDSINSNDSIPSDSMIHTNEGLLKRLTLICRLNLEQKLRTSCLDAEEIAFRFVFPIFLALSIFGCSLTLIVYGSKFLKHASTVLLLATKALANLAGVCCLSLEMVRYYSHKDEMVEEIFWYSRPYTLFMANYFGTLAVWCTLLVTLETYLCIAYPIHFRRWAKKRNVYIVILILLFLDGCHHVALPIMRTTVEYTVCFKTLKQYSMMTKNHTVYLTYERIYFYINCVAVIVVPNLSMILLSFLIAVQLQSKSMGQNFSQRRRCVVRITITTTVCYLVLETPNLIIFLTAAVRGSAYENNESLCVVSVITNFLAMLNAVVPFFVYVSFNSTFRQLLIVQVAPILGITVPDRTRNGYDCMEVSRLTGTSQNSTVRNYVSGTKNGRLSNFSNF